MSKINKKLLYLDDIFPIGKTEIFFDNNDHSNYMGFTWQRTAVGKAIVGIDPNDTDFNTIGKTGGSKYLQEHNHYTTANASGAGQDANKPIALYNATDLPYSLYSADASATRYPTGNAGTGNSGNLQPYMVFAIWVRTA